jgi:hypothetical protein
MILIVAMDAVRSNSNPSSNTLYVSLSRTCSADNKRKNRTAGLFRTLSPYYRTTMCRTTPSFKAGGTTSTDTDSPIWPSVAGGVAFAGAVTIAIWITAAYIDRDQETEIHGRSGIAFDYQWRLEHPQVERSAWIGYALHNMASWLVIWAAKNFHNQKYAAGWSWPNWSMLAVHLVFAVLHMVQTHVWYDGLARDVPEVTALSSVALMLMVVIALENPRRGFILGKKVSFPKLMVETIKYHHGYLFSWALTYTFWYHPTVATSGHLWGFFYLYMLLWQSVLIYTPVHLNRKWTLALEVMVIPHSVAVAIGQGKGHTPMFLFGFLGVFCLTQMYALELKTSVRRTVWLAYVTSILATYVYMDRKCWCACAYRLFVQ